MSPPTKRYERSTAGMREMLFDTLEGVIAGEVKPVEAVQRANVVKTIIATADLELRAQRPMKEMDPDNADAQVLAPPVVLLGKDTKALPPGSREES